MKCYAILLAILGVISAVSATPVRHGLFVHQGGRLGYYARPVQYRMYTASRRSGDASETGISAFAAGNTVATGTLLQDCDPAVDGVVADTGSLNGGSQSVAEAYPEYPLSQADDFDVPQGDQPLEPLPPAVQADAPLPVAPVLPPKKVNKVKVQLDDEDDEEDAFNTKGQGGRNGGASSFFPVNFGRTNGGAIAVANSFSTGKGGTATSHATAYGSPKSKSR